jgi:hypothetical protein
VCSVVAYFINFVVRFQNVFTSEITVFVNNCEYCVLLNFIIYLIPIPKSNLFCSHTNKESVGQMQQCTSATF